MSKVLSVCVPSYNMEKYLNRCVDSFLVPEILNRLELIIVSDGSTDNTLSIANDYKARYPQTIVVIDKPNGHYGSCVNASLKVATGKYFRIVDADDWVDSNALVTFINKLETIDVDCVCTKYTIHNLRDETTITKELEIESNKLLNLNEFRLPKECLHMHNLTYSLSLLNTTNYKPTKGICYTDTEYACIPLSYSTKMCYIDISLYQYYIGRDDQSMSQAVLQKNFKHLVQVINRLLSIHEKNLPFNKNENLIWSALLRRLIVLATPSYILNGIYDKEIDNTLRESIKKLYQMNIYLPDDVFRNRFHGIPYVSLWYHAKSYSWVVFILFRSLNKAQR
jgi:glycosyltransferase involved in cell wall biosynthesis